MFLLPWPVYEHNFSGFIFGRDLYNFSLLGAKEWCHAEIGTFFTTWFFYETSSKFFHLIMIQAHRKKLDQIPRQHLWVRWDSIFWVQFSLQSLHNWGALDRGFSKKFQLKQGGHERVAREAGKDYFCAQRKWSKWNKALLETRESWAFKL